MAIGIVGYGVVGKALGKLFGYLPGNDSVRIYDKGLPDMNDAQSKSRVQACDLVFVAVPTPEAADGSCDLRAVEEVVSWITPPMCLKSTVQPGTVDRLVAATGKRICFSPEYIGETRWHSWRDIADHGFVIVGGEKSLCEMVIRVYQRALGPTARYYVTDAKTAELCKYMENAFLATKVAFVNQFFDLDQAYSIDFNELRELWLADERIGRSHTMVTEERGYRGRCLPKDMAAIIRAAKSLGGAPLLEAVDRYNDEICRRSDSQQGSIAARSPKAKVEN
jgi:UDPglucose 6-dehydrogenase